MSTIMSYTIPDDKIEGVGKLLKYTKNMSTQEVLENAMELLEWAINETNQGRDIVAVNHNSGAYSMSKSPIIENIKKSKELHTTK